MVSENEQVLQAVRQEGVFQSHENQKNELGRYKMQMAWRGVMRGVFSRWTYC